jgi:hypothetical protein
MKNHLKRCPCGSGKEAEALYDGHNIFMTYACDACRKKKIAKFRPDIFEKYETDEQIEEDY